MTALEQARELLSRGLSVFPLPLGSKVPVIAWKPFQERLASEDELLAWFGDGQPANIGIVTGAISNLVVVDADSPRAIAYSFARLPQTPWRTRTANGLHFYFRHPGEPVMNWSADITTATESLPIHVRGDGGYVLAPGSRHPSGRRYIPGHQSAWTEPLDVLPCYDPAWLRVRRRPASHLEINVGRSVSPPQSKLFPYERARRYLAAIPRPEIGHGSDLATFQAACRLVRGFALPLSDAECLLWAWCGNREGWTRDWVASKVTSAGKHGREAMGGLR